MAETSDKEHDKGYRDVLSNKSAFLHVLKKYSGESWAGDISPDDIEQVNASFVTDDFKDLYSDLIFKIKKDDGEVYFYVLLELQSQVDHTMPFRILKYVVALLNDIFNNTPRKVRERKDFRLPAVVPMVLYNGEDNWTAVRSFREYTKGYELFGGSIIDFKYDLFDIRRTDKSKILANRKFPDLIFAFDRSRSDEMDVEEMVKILQEDAPRMTDEERRIITGWLSRAVFIGVDPEQIKETFLQTVKQGGEKSMKHGLTVFMEERDERVRKEKAIAIAKKMLAKDRPIEEIAECTGLEIADIVMLQSAMA